MARTTVCDIAEIAKSERGRGKTFQMNQLCMCLALSMPPRLVNPLRKPRILAKLSAEVNSSDYLAFPVCAIFPLAIPRKMFDKSRIELQGRKQKIRSLPSESEIVIFILYLSLVNSIHV